MCYVLGGNKYHTSIYYLVLDFKLVGSCQVTPREFLLSKILLIAGGASQMYETKSLRPNLLLASSLG